MLDKTNEEIINLLANDGSGGEWNFRARIVLQKILKKNPESFKTLAIDLQDMQMKGKQIVRAFETFARSKVEFFLQACAHRDEGMVAMVNDLCPDKVARRHGEQRTLPKIDQAVSGIMRDAQNNNVLMRLDEGADAIHGLFKTMLLEMQRSRVYVANFRLNLDGEGWARFQVGLVGLEKPDGTPFEVQPHDEVTKMAQPSVDIFTQARDYLEKECGISYTRQTVRGIFDGLVLSCLEKDVVIKLRAAYLDKNKITDGTKSGRTSSAEPNESNTPKSGAKENADIPGTLVDTDGSVEQRISDDQKPISE